jgi:hypothetical protein
MAWARRRYGRYYYRSVRQGTRVTKTYLGTGLLGELAEFLDAEERAERQEKAAEWQQTRKDLEALDAQFSAWWNTGSAIIDATLTAAGYYRHHRGVWRKRAEPESSASAAQQGEQGE